MTPGRPRASGVPSTKTRLREPDDAAGGDFVWPPPDDDPASCSMILLEAEAGPRSRPRPAMFADTPMEAFPDIDLDTALDAFADLPAAAHPPAASRPAPQRPPTARPPASRWRITGMWSVVPLCVGASLALAPPAGPPSVPEPRALDVPATFRPRAAAPRHLASPDGRVAPAPAADPSPRQSAPRDEDHIRATLAELRTAYSRLDAGAARKVWPSVDVDALARAFADLISQELRFDHCAVTVDGADAHATCIGEAVYVPRVGGAVASSAARAWTFELTRLRGRWMIASARASESIRTGLRRPA
jgi:hypothetical protein